MEGNKSIYVHKMISAGAVTSATGFIAKNQHCNWDDAKQDYNRYTDGEKIYNRHSTYVLPNKVSTDSVHCKRIYPSDDTSGEIDIYCKKVKLENTKGENILQADFVSSNKSWVNNSFVSEESSTLGGIVKLEPTNYVNIASTNYAEKVDDSEATLAIEKPSLLVHGSIKCSKLIGEVSSKSSNYEDLKTGNISSNKEGGMIKFGSPIDGVPSIHVTSYDYGYFTDYDNNVTPYLLFAKEKLDENEDEDENKWKFNTATYKNMDLSSYLSEYEFTHGAYCSNHSMFKCMNMLYTPIVKSSNPYIDASGTGDDPCKSQVLLDKTCSISKAISISKDLKTNNVLYTKFLNFIRAYYASEKNYVKNFNELDHGFEIDLGLYNDEDPEDKEVKLIIILPDFNMTQTTNINYLIREDSENYKTDVYPIIEGYDITEYTLQFLFFNFFSDFFKELNGAITDRTYVGYDLCKSTGITLADEGEITLSPGEFASFEHQLEPYERNQILEKFLWEGLKSYLLNSSNTNVNPVDITKSLNLKMVLNTIAPTADIDFKMHKWLNNGIKTYNFKRIITQNEIIVTPALEYIITTTAPTFGTLGVHDLDGDVEMTGTLNVKEIENKSGEGDEFLHIPRLDVDKFSVNGTEYHMNATNAASELGTTHANGQLYYTKSSRVDKADKCSNVNGRDAPKVVMDLNYIGSLVFVGIRSFIIPGYLVDFYIPNGCNPHGYGAIKFFPIGEEMQINPYNFSVFTEDMELNPVICTKTEGLDKDNSKIDIITGYMNQDNGYIIASTTAKLYYVDSNKYISGGEMKKPEDISCSETFVIDFVVYNGDLTFLNMRFRENLGKHNFKQEGKEVLYMLVNGFRYTAVLADKSEINGASGVFYKQNDALTATYTTGTIKYMTKTNQWVERTVSYTQLSGVYIIKTDTDMFVLEDALMGNNLLSVDTDNTANILARYYQVSLLASNKDTLAYNAPIYDKREVKLYLNPLNTTTLYEMKEGITYKLYHSNMTGKCIFEKSNSLEIIDLSKVGNITELLSKDTWNISSGGKYYLRLMKEDYDTIMNTPNKTLDDATMKKIEITITVN